MSYVAANLGCTEADTLAYLLRATGAEQAADGMRWSPALADTQEER
ncbi:hypothetical protein ACGFWE_40285 [Streptomyces sp. NPDC048523]